MEKTIVSKVTRFIELSNKFSKSVNDLFPNENKYSSDIVINNVITGYSNKLTYTIDGRELYIEDGVVKAKDKNFITRAEIIRGEAEVKAKLSDEFDEFNKLKNELAEYFTALKKITE
jgi:hypothetical protein